MKVHFFANMGSCQCGDVDLLAVVVGDTVYTNASGNSWQSGRISDGKMSVPYAGSVKVDATEIRNIGQTEFNDRFGSLPVDVEV